MTEEKTTETTETTTETTTEPAPVDRIEVTISEPAEEDDEE